MSLIKTIEEIKKYVSVNISFDIDSIAPDIAWAEEEYIKKYLGKAQYDDLCADYKSGIFSDPATLLLEKVQFALSNIAYAKYLAIGQLSIDDAGIRIQVDGSYKTAFQWQVDGVERYFLSKGFSGLEWLLFHLEENAADYPLWKNSSAYTVFKKFFINSSGEFLDHYPIQHKHTFMAIVPVMKKVEDFTFMDVLSEEYFDELKAEIATGSISADTKKLLRYLQPALAHLTIAKAIPELALEISGSGVHINEVAALTPNAIVKKQAPDQLLSAKMNQAYSDGMAYLNKMIAYLNAQASETKYPTYYQKVILPKQTQSQTNTNEKSNIYGAF